MADYSDYCGHCGVDMGHAPSCVYAPKWVKNQYNKDEAYRLELESKGWESVVVQIPGSYQNPGRMTMYKYLWGCGCLVFQTADHRKNVCPKPVA